MTASADHAVFVHDESSAAVEMPGSAIRALVVASDRQRAGAQAVVQVGRGRLLPRKGGQLKGEALGTQLAAQGIEGSEFAALEEFRAGSGNFIQEFVIINNEARRFRQCRGG